MTHTNALKTRRSPSANTTITGNTMNIIEMRVPERWLYYLINGDFSGYDDDELDAIQEWLDVNDVTVIGDIADTTDHTLFDSLYTHTALINCLKR
jgi:squalene cyclase